MLFNAAREGAELLFLVIIPAVAVVFVFIGFFDYVGIWSKVESSLSSLLLVLNVHPESGVLSILASPALAMGQLSEIATEINPKLVVGSFILASSGLPLSTIFGQIPVIWGENSDLNERQAMGAAVIGAIMRLVTAFLIAFFLTPILL